MHHAARSLAGLLLLAAAACGPRAGEVETQAAAEGFVGPVTYRYDPDLLIEANVTIPVPARENEEAYAVKLLPARSIEGSPELCPSGAEACPAEIQPGITLAFLERPFDSYERALRDSELAEGITRATVDGIEGIAVDGGTENGLEVEYRLVPVDNRALLIKRQRDDQSASEMEALDDVVASLDLGD